MTSSHRSFYVFRRFSSVRARLLLYKQDIITQLESELEQVDRDESQPLFHGSRRRDINAGRRAILIQLDAAVSEFGLHFRVSTVFFSTDSMSLDALVARTRETLSLRSPGQREIRSLRDWIGASGCISREESRYLWRDNLMAIGLTEPDSFLDSLGGFMEDVLMFVSNHLSGVRNPQYACYYLVSFR